MDTVDLPRRLKAARVLADLTVTQLAAKLDTPGFGAKTLGAIERGERSIRPHEIRVLADAVGVPETFFTEPLAGSVGSAMAIDDRLARLETIALQNQALVVAVLRGMDISENSGAAQALAAAEEFLERQAARDRATGLGATSTPHDATGS